MTMKIGLIGYGKMNRLIEKACKHPIVSITKDHVHDLSADLYFDFSHKSAVERNALILAKHGKSVIIGTTGWQSDKVASAFEQNGAALYCPNFSKEVARFFLSVEALCKILGPPIKATEWHHKTKKDSPSGTALKLTEITGVPFKSVRTDDTIFKHQLEWDEITLAHEARDRKAYVLGALEAAEWLYGKKGWHDDYFRHVHASGHTI